MRAWRAHELGAPEAVLRLEELDDPVAGPGQVVVKVAACALNFPDNLVLAGEYQEKPPLPLTPGMEVGGTVEAVGAGVGIAIGTRVLALAMMPNGGLAERMVTHERAVHAIPDSMSFEEASALWVTYQTGHVALHRRADLRAGETLLVHAAAGGVGSAAVQLGKAAGATVIATAGGPDKVKVALDLGADIAIDYRAEDFVAVVKDATGGRGADVIYDPVGGEIFDRSRKVIAWEGRLLIIGFTSGRIPEVSVNHLLLKNYSVVGVHWARYNMMNPALVEEVAADLFRLFEEGHVKPLIG
ncbi:MAG: NADPH:quinone reductase, partial [Actinomycetota bacterium]|nr:NADPH:quinone reductase [Actinomycetota bacterium]